MKVFFIPIFCLFLYNSCHFTPESGETVQKRNSEWVKGITLVAPPNEFVSDPMLSLKEINSEWIAVVPYAFSPANSTDIYYDEGKQWWGETREGILQTIQLAHDADLKVLLKPHLWLRGQWTGDMEFDAEEDWVEWEREYIRYITDMAAIADSLNVEMFCIGNEFRNFVQSRTEFWTKLIDTVDNVYSGDLTYGANWDEFEDVPFWGKLDYIGINAYFPLIDKKLPKFEDLVRAWRPIKERIEAIHEKFNKPVLFTEYGYLSTEYNAHSTWEKERRLQELESSEVSQDAAIDALLYAFYSEDWWRGGFLWKWYPPDYRIRNGEKDYSPQGKLAENTLNNWFLK